MSSVRISLSKSSLAQLTQSPDFTIPLTDAGTFAEACMEFTSSQEKLERPEDSTEDGFGFKSTNCSVPRRKYQDPQDTVGSQLHPGP